MATRLYFTLITLAAVLLVTTVSTTRAQQPEQPAASAAAKAPVTAAEPALTGEQKAQVQLLLKTLEAEQAKAQAAQAMFALVQGQLQQMLTSLHKDGYDLDLTKLIYVKRPVLPKPEKQPQS